MTENSPINHFELKGLNRSLNSELHFDLPFFGNKKKFPDSPRINDFSPYSIFL